MGNNPWLYILLLILGTTGLILMLSLLAGLCVCFAARHYGKKLGNRTEQELLAHLPKTNCTQCGFSSCEAFARSLLQDGGREKCPHLSEEDRQALTEKTERFHELLTDPTPPRKKKRPRFLGISKNED